ncbi:hypothetical protein C8J57DRAFT_1233270 [Mycena rebaudengoi]|nr:hypothetical protein C8J57DRAFT_1233270 [Mycena rebaudengoi]
MSSITCMISTSRHGYSSARNYSAAASRRPPPSYPSHLHPHLRSHSRPPVNTVPVAPLNATLRFCLPWRGWAMVHPAHSSSPLHARSAAVVGAVLHSSRSTVNRARAVAAGWEPVLREVHPGPKRVPPPSTFGRVGQMNTVLATRRGCGGTKDVECARARTPWPMMRALRSGTVASGGSSGGDAGAPVLAVAVRGPARVAKRAMLCCASRIPTPRNSVAGITASRGGNANRPAMHLATTAGARARCCAEYMRRHLGGERLQSTAPSSLSPHTSAWLLRIVREQNSFLSVPLASYQPRMDFQTACLVLINFGTRFWVNSSGQEPWPQLHDI